MNVTHRPQEGLSGGVSDAPTILAITVHRNDLEGLKRTCGSFDHQVYPHARQLVIDGASSDGTLEWLATAGASERRQFHSGPDSGIFDAMNRGLRLASGDIITFLNAGDCLPDPETLAFVAQSWAATRWRWAVGAIQYVDDTGSGTHTYSCSPLVRRRMELGLNFIPHPGAYFELEFARGLGEFDESFSVAADQEFLLRALKAQAPVEWDRVMSLFESGGASGSVSQFRTQLLLHRIRAAHGAEIVNSRAVDATYAIALALFREIRLGARRLKPRPQEQFRD